MADTHSLEALAAIVDIAADAIIALDNDFRIVRFNKGAEQIFGWTEEEMLKQPLDRLLPMTARPVHRGHVRTFAEGSTESRRMAERREIAGLRRNGEQFPAEASIARVTINGERTFMVTLRDVSARRYGEERQQLLATAGWVLAASLDVESTMATITELPVPLLGDWSVLELLSPQGHIRRVAATHKDPLRHDESSALVSRVSELLEADLPATSAGRVAHETEAQRITDVASWLSANFHDAASRVRAEALGASAVLIVPLRAGGRAIGALHLVRSRPGSTHSIEEVVVAGQFAGLAALALENARLYQESRRAVRERDDMLAIVSHDLRNPVNAIVMLTGAVLNREPGDERPLMDRDDVEAIRGAARQADGLIQDLQDVSRIATARLQVERQPVLLSELVKESADMFEPVMEDAILRFVRQIDDQLPPVQADRHRIEQVLSNLLGNAVRFTPHGGEIVLTASRHHDHVRISVCDTGPGVAPDDVPRLFERHWQAPRLLRAGSGLGLFIAKGIVEAHGGEIGVESVIGEGSEFWFTVPL
ncbi:sensor histidine kinase [Gemmatimonas groenlandica]|uniref:histidine kinase n=1 Tax=Gemmatimonas groenlandica TaxID=2732249 RepID=A0A6M4II70_9BACT|nr:GAF domain-containing sensor histidine kinase [Gemmatimonas groenlandica]QJR34320.1 PAS domain S-box protein [Gemmatimonas groenlandica]